MRGRRKKGGGRDQGERWETRKSKGEKAKEKEGIASKPSHSLIPPLGGALTWLELECHPMCTITGMRDTPKNI